MHSDASGFPRKLSDAFDFSVDHPLSWEIDIIQRAVRDGRYRLLPHAIDRILDRGINARQVRQAILNGTAVSKDLPSNNINRVPGLNFEGTTDDGLTIRVKVTWSAGYAVVTAHEVA